ncbi:hypothetical protein ACS0TY_009146 [Phlomoides rotata]
MAHCLSNLSISHPISSNSPLYTPNPLRSRCSTLLNPSISGRIWPKNVVKSMAADGRDNLDYLQRQQKQPQQHQNQQPRKRTAPVAPIGLWDRFPTARTVQQMMETMERMMEDPLTYSAVWPSPLPQSDGVGYSRGRTPWEIKEAETEYKMRFDMPGMTKQDVKIWVEEKMLVVKAEKLPKKDENINDWSVKSYGKYSSRIALPENVEFDKIKAEVKDGVLYITIPKASSRAKVFDINVE